ncbi:MAG: AAA family ATPase [Desulforhopalus sp.]|nr:AAA family ATPase [Desulforhopalus sp.]
MEDKSGHPLAAHLKRMGLHANPFPVTPDASNYFISQSLKVCLTELRHCIRERKGFLLVTADVGAGKTTLSRRLIATLEQEMTRVALVFNSFLHGISLLEAINQDFGISATGGIGEQLGALNEYLLQQFEQGKNCVIIIDDAQNLDIESLELIRQISNLETNKAKLVQILLIAQPEIMATLAYPELRQLNSRIALRIGLAIFSTAEVMNYVSYRLECAGNEGRITLNSGALKLLRKKSGGYPRQINLLMDRSLYALTAAHTTVITSRIIQLAADDLAGGMAPVRTWSWRPVFASIAGAIVVILTVGIWWAGGRENRSVVVDLKYFAHQAAAGLSLKPFTDKATARKTPEPIVSTQGEEESPELSLHRQARIFLKTYNLEKFYPDFVSALGRDDWQQFDQSIRPTGWRLLISQKKLSDNKDALYSIRLAGKPHWLSLWQPDFELGPFYFGASSPGIKKLQQGLSTLGLYSSQIDGIAGLRTISAVAVFQRQSGLYPSADPDMLTLYQLSQELHKRFSAVEKNLM